VAGKDKPREPLNVKQYPAVVVHGLVHARAVLAVGRPVTLLSARGAALYAGAAWWLALMGRLRLENRAVSFEDILDCADASGLALSALRIGQRIVVLEPEAPGWSSVTAIAGSLGCEVLTHRPPALDMSIPSEGRRLRVWLRVQTRPDDIDPAVS
jgi:hypothetical protein